MKLLDLLYTPETEEQNYDITNYQEKYKLDPVLDNLLVCLDYSADIYYKDDTGNNALDYARRIDHTYQTEFVELLMSNDKVVDVKDPGYE